MKSPLIEQEIQRLETYNKKGESYANANGSFGWRNPIRQDTGKILESLVISARPKRILEFGTAHGLSALYLVLGLNPDDGGFIDTVEFDTAVANDSQERFDTLTVPIRVHALDAQEAISGLTGTYDMVFFDAQKSHYLPQLLALLEKKLAGPGTVLLADNVIDRESECRDFLDWFVANNVNHTIIPTECGLLVARL
ncbi:MAG: hypothetical protein RL213_1071 [Bacteroidota bacterium]|jgi:predicted O-methyltransferase YrrM